MLKKLMTAKYLDINFLEDDILLCIMGENCNCVYNQDGFCGGKPELRDLGCLGTVCWNMRN